MGCSSSSQYSQISPESEVVDEREYFVSEKDADDDSAERLNLAGLLNKPGLGQTKAPATSPKEALALDLHLLSSNIEVAHTIEPAPEIDLLTHDLCHYGLIKDGKECAAGAVKGQGETFAAQRQMLIAALCREVSLRSSASSASASRSKSAGVGGGGDVATAAAAPHRPQGFLQMLFRTSPAPVAPTAAEASAQQYVFTPPDAAGVLQAGQVFIDLQTGYRQYGQRQKMRMLPSNTGLSSPERDDGKYEDNTPGSGLGYSSPIRESPAPSPSQDRTRQGGNGNHDPRARGSHSPSSSSKSAFSPLPGGMQASGALDSPSTKAAHRSSQLERARDYALSTENSLILIDLCLAQSRAMLLQYFQAMTSPALSQKQVNAQSPMALALGALRHTDALVTHVRSIGEDLAGQAEAEPGQVGRHASAAAAAAAAHSLWVQCVSQACRTIHSLATLLSHHVHNTGDEHKYTNNKRTLFSLVAHTVPLLLPLVRNIAPCIALQSESAGKQSRGRDAAHYMDSLTTAVYVDAAIVSLRRAFWSGCSVLLDLANTINVCGGIMGHAAVSSGSSSSPSGKNKSARAVQSAGRLITERVREALELTSPVTRDARLTGFVNSLALTAGEYLSALALAQCVYNGADSQRGKAGEADWTSQVFAHNEGVVRTIVRSYGTRLGPSSELLPPRPAPTFTAPVPDSSAAVACALTLACAVDALSLVFRAGAAGLSSSEIGAAMVALLDSPALSVLRPVGGDRQLNDHLCELAPALAELLCAACAVTSQRQVRAASRRSADAATLSLSQYDACEGASGPSPSYGMLPEVVFELALRLAGFSAMLRDTLAARRLRQQRASTAELARGATVASAAGAAGQQGTAKGEEDASAAGTHSPGRGRGKGRALSMKTAATTGSASGKVDVSFAVGDKVDGLCVLKNGSKRWFAGVVAAVNATTAAGESAKEESDDGCSPEYTYSVSYEDGDVQHGKPAAEVRRTKKREVKRVGIPATAEETGFTARALETLAMQQQQQQVHPLSGRSNPAVASRQSEWDKDKENTLTGRAEINTAGLGVLSSFPLKSSKSPRPGVPFSQALADVTNSSTTPVKPKGSPDTAAAASASVALERGTPPPPTRDAEASLRSLLSPRTDIGSDDNEFFIIPSVLDDAASRSRQSMPQVPRMEFDMALLSQSVQSLVSLSSFPTGERDLAMDSRSLGGSAVNTFRSTHLDSFRFPRDRAESLTAADAHAVQLGHGVGSHHPSSSLYSANAMGLALPGSLFGSARSAAAAAVGNSPARAGAGAGATFSAMQSSIAASSTVRTRVALNPPISASATASASASAANTSAISRMPEPELVPEYMDAPTLHSLLRTYSLLAAALLPHCVHADRLHGDYTTCSVSGGGGKGSSRGRAVNVLYAIREFYEILHSAAEFGAEADAETGTVTSADVSRRLEQTAQAQSYFETAMLRCTAPHSAARRLLLLSGLSSSLRPVPSIPCLVSHLSGNHSNNSNLSLGKGGFADVSLVLCPVDCPCNPLKSRVGEFCAAIGLDTTTDPSDSGAIAAHKLSLIEVAKQRLARKFAIKRLRRERSAAEDPPAISNIFNEITCLEALRDADAIGVCRLLGFGVTDVEYVLALEVGGKNLSDWRGELTPHIFSQAVCDVLRRGHYNKGTPAPWPCSICVRAPVVASQLLPFATQSVDNDCTTDAAAPSFAVPPPEPALADLDTIFSLLLLELYWDVILIVQGVHKRDIAHFDIKCANFMFKFDASVEEEERAAQELRQRQLIQAEKEDAARIAEQRVEAAALGAKLKSLWDYGALLDAKKAETKAASDEEAERRAKGTEQLSVLKAKCQSGKNPKVKAAYTADIETLEARLKADRAARRASEEDLAGMQRRYDELKTEADACEARHSEANAHRAAARSATRAALGMDNVDDDDDTAAQSRLAQQLQLRILVSLLRSMPYMRACHLNGVPSGVLLLFDFGESVPHSTTWAPEHASPYERRCRGTLPIQAPELLSLGSSNSAAAAAMPAHTPLSSASASASNLLIRVPSRPSNLPGDSTDRSLLAVSTSGADNSMQAARTRIPAAFPSPGRPADVWAVACLLSELVTGEFLFVDRPWTELYVSMCTVRVADCTGSDGVVRYDVEGNVDTSFAPPLEVPLAKTTALLCGGGGGLFADRYKTAFEGRIDNGNGSSLEQPASASIPSCASANLQAATAAVEAAVRKAFARTPVDRPDAVGLGKLVGGALRNVAFSKGDINAHSMGAAGPASSTAQSNLSSVLSASAPASAYSASPGTALSTTADTLWADERRRLTLAAACLSDLLGLVDQPSQQAGNSSGSGNSNSGDQAGVFRVVSRVGHSAWARGVNDPGGPSSSSSSGCKLHVVCFTTRAETDAGVIAAVSMLRDLSDATPDPVPAPVPVSVGVEVDDDDDDDADESDGDARAAHVHTAFPAHRLHEHAVEELDCGDAQVMRQWSDLHEDWLHKFDVWEPADQHCLDHPGETIISRGGKILGIFMGGHLAASISFKPVESLSSAFNSASVSGSHQQWELMKLAVHPTHARQGLGRLILRWTIDHLCEQARRANAARCSISLESNKRLVAALALYTAHGFLVTHERDLVAEARAAEVATAREAALALERKAAEAASRKRPASTETSSSRKGKAQPAQTDSGAAAAAAAAAAALPVVHVPAVAPFPSAYETCDIIMELTIDVRQYVPQLTAADLSPRPHPHTHTQAGNALRSTTTRARSSNPNPTPALSLHEWRGGGSLCFVHVSAASEQQQEQAGAVEDVALAVQSILSRFKAAESEGSSSSSSIDQQQQQYLILVDPMLPLAPTGLRGSHGSPRLPHMHSASQSLSLSPPVLDYHCMCVCGAAVLLEELGELELEPGRASRSAGKAMAGGVGLGLGEVERPAGQGQGQGRGLARAIVSSILPSPSPLRAVGGCGAEGPAAAAVEPLACVESLLKLLRGCS